MTKVPINNRYIAKESLTFPLVLVVIFVMCLYEAINTSETWFIIDVAFFGLILIVYAYKYIRYGRTTLIIDSEAITLKDWSKTKIHYWHDIVRVYTEWRRSYTTFAQQWLTVETKIGDRRNEFYGICLFDLYCRSKSVRKAIEKYAGQCRFDYEASREAKRYVSKILLVSIVAFVVIFICLTYFSE